MFQVVGTKYVWVGAQRHEFKRVLLGTFADLVEAQGFAFERARQTGKDVLILDAEGKALYRVWNQYGIHTTMRDIRDETEENAAWAALVN